MTSFPVLLCGFLSAVIMATASPAPPVEIQNVDPSDPEVQACVNFALENFNYFSKDPNLYAITKFYSVKRHAIGGGQYHMDVEVRRTNAIKDQVKYEGDISSISEPEVFRCHFVVLSAPWKKQRVLLQSSCSPLTSSGLGML
ncbi:cystatin-like [Brienomyrus brachyistius]|uniref:cystatin-like n=1 Tax=Brienomyrus brachyistius TaxID=42636 RepID=UPI0020B1A40D|nr:cystatin-like [Brienomyrus brachyistius]